MNTLIAPSILSADFLNLEQDILKVKGCDYLHMDVMDGHYVPNITFGPQLVKRVKTLGIPMDVHLMISNPENYIESFINAGASFLTVHAEASIHLHRNIMLIKELGAKPGVALNPSTPLNMIENVLEDLDLVLIMTVNPGFGGQSFIKSMLKKIATLNDMIQKIEDPSKRPIIEVDGGIDVNTAPLVCSAGAQMLVAGSAIFKKDDPQKAMQEILNSVR